jgi:8-oxo-dGTP diphosphatase
MEKLFLHLWGHLPIPRWLRWRMLWAGNQKFLIGVAAVILDENNRVLFFKHTYRPEMPWGIPGGWLKKNENPARAAEREIREESGMRVEVLHPVRVATREYGVGLDIIYAGRFLGGDFNASAEVSEARFCALGEFPRVYPETDALARRAIELIARDR